MLQLARSDQHLSTSRVPTMKAFTISAAVAVLLAQAHASPMKAEARQFQAQLTFEGAPPQAAAFTVSIPADGTSFIIRKCRS